MPKHDTTNYEGKHGKGGCLFGFLLLPLVIVVALMDQRWPQPAERSGCKNAALAIVVGGLTVASGMGYGVYLGIASVLS